MKYGDYRITERQQAFYTFLYKVIHRAISSNVILHPRKNKGDRNGKLLEVFFIKEGISEQAGGIAVWFNSLVHSADLKGTDICIFSSTTIGSTLNIGNASLQYSDPPSIQQALVSFFRNSFIRKLLAKFNWDSEEAVDYLIVYFFIKHCNGILKSGRRIHRITVPIYEGYGSYLPAIWPVSVALVSGTREAIKDLEITKSRYLRHYLPKLIKESALLLKFSSRIAISSDIIKAYEGYRRDESFEVSHPRIRDPYPIEAALEYSRLGDVLQRKNIILYIGRMEPRKGFDILLNAWPISGLAEIGYELYMCGDYGSETNPSLRTAPSVNWRGNISPQEKQALFATSKLVVIPSRSESFGIVAIEAMSYGTPVLAADVPGLHYIATLANSVKLFNGKDSKSCAHMMSQLISSVQDWNSLSTSVRKDFEDYFKLP